MITYYEHLKSQGQGVKPGYNEVLNFNFWDRTWWRKHFVSCGTCVGLIRHKMDISVSKEIDEDEGYKGYAWANLPYISALQYCAITINQQNKKWGYWKKKGIKHKKPCPLPPNSTFLEFETPAIKIYHLSDVQAVVNAGHGEFWRNAEDCKTHVYEPSEFKKYIGEFTMEPEHEPEPFKIIIGGHCGTFSPKHVRHLNTIAIPDLQKQNPHTDILVFPNAKMSTGKKPGLVQTDMVTMTGLKTIGYLYNTLHKYYP